MYATCLFCNRPFATNDTFENFPIGRRLAFDSSKGRLWVVCQRCERWNLSPLDERWEVVEQAEALYAKTRRRVSTEQIGLAKLRDGMELVRIGAPLRPEFASWRYGDQFGRRRRRRMLVAGAGLGALGAIAVGGAAVGIGLTGFAGLFVQLGSTALHGSPETVVARIRTSQGLLAVRRRHLAETQLLPGSDGPLALYLRFKGGSAQFDGAEAQRIASIVLPHANAFGGSKETIANAVDSIERAAGADGFLDNLSTRAAVATRPSGRPRGRRTRRAFGPGRQGLFGLSPVDRLALEMALHEEAERRALEGELTALERAWRDAEEVAAIADDMFVPAAVTSALETMRAK